MDSDIITVYKILNELLVDRGYFVPKNLQFNTLSELEKKWQDRDSIDFIVNRPNDPEDNIAVFFFGDAKININLFRNRVKQLDTRDIKSAIFISREPKSFTSKAKSELADLGKNITIFEERELKFNITKHNLVNHHQLLLPDEAKEVFDIYQAKDVQFPKIYVSDPVSKYYGFQPGQLIRINRKSNAAGTYSHYRLVVPDLDN